MKVKTRLETARITPLTAGLMTNAARTAINVTGRANRNTTFESCLIRLPTTCDPATVAAVTTSAVADPTRLAPSGVGEVLTSGSDTGLTVERSATGPLTETTLVATAVGEGAAATIAL